MEKKRSVKSDLERRRPTFLKIGLIASLAFALMAFEYKTWIATSRHLGDLDLNLFEEELPPLPKVKKEVKKEKKKTPTNFIPDPDPEPEPEPEPDPEPKKKEPLQLFALDSIGDTEPVDPVGPTGPFVKVEAMPHFKDCAKEANREKCTEIGFIQHLHDHLRVPRDMTISEKAYVYFVVDATGQVVDVKLMNDVHPSLEREILRVFAKMPNLVPGKQRGQNVPVMYTIPVNVKIK